MAGAEEEKEEETEETNDATLVSSFRGALKTRIRLRAEASSGEHTYPTFGGRRLGVQMQARSLFLDSGFARCRSRLGMTKKFFVVAPYTPLIHTLRSFPRKREPKAAREGGRVALGLRFCGDERCKLMGMTAHWSPAITQCIV
jgi:hypothetical protein